MMNTVRVELTNSISPDLNWKVSKGYRSASRRSRKLVDRSQKSSTELAEKSARSPSETTVSESEKNGVAVLGRRFSDKIEHVPIKKRRFMVRSPSPPSRLTSPHLEENQPLLDAQDDSREQSCPKSISKKHPSRSGTSTLTRLGHSGVNENLKKVKNEMPGDREDFSGIEILAAAACNNSINDDMNHAEDNAVGGDLSRDEKDASPSARPLEQTIASTSSTVIIPVSEISEARDTSICAVLEESIAFLETVHLSQKDVPHEDKIGNSSFEATVVKINPTEEDDQEVARSISSKDVRFHWDLNVAMDAWEEPCNTAIVDPQTSAVENIAVDNKKDENLQVSEAHETLEDADAKNGIASKEQPLVDSEEQGLKVCPEFEIKSGECAPTDNALKSSTDAGRAEKASSQDVIVDARVEHSPSIGFDSITVTVPVSEESNKTPTAGFAVEHMTKDTASGVQLGETVCPESANIENPFIACVPEGASCEIESTVLDDDGKGSGAASSFHEDPKSPEDMMGVESCHSLVPVLLEVKPLGKTEDVAVDHSKLDCDDKSASGTSVGEGPSLLTLNAKEPVEAASETHTVDSQPNAGSEEVMHKPSGNSIMDPVAASGSSSHEQCHYGLDACQDDKDHMVGKENTMGHEAGYDSQYEDGELRESDVPYWEENEFEDGEAECVDYGSDTCDSEAAEDSISGKVGMGLECRATELVGSESRKMNRNVKVVRGLSPGSDKCEKNEHAFRQSSVGSKTKTSGSDQFPGDSEASSNRTAEATDGCTIRRHTANCFNGKSSPARVVGSMASETSNRMSTGCARRRFDNFDSSVRSEDAGSDQSMGKEKSDSRMQGRSSGGVHLVNPSGSYWDSKRRESPTYHGSFGSVRSRPKGPGENHGYEMDPDDTYSEAAGVEGIHNRVRRHPITFSSSRLYQPPLRRRSPAERNDTHNIHRGMIPMRETSPDRRRFRRYPQGVSRGIREEYHRPMPDDPNECSYIVPRRMARREQSTSPPGRGPIYYSRPYKKSQYRCRSRSPLAWGLPRDRNDVSRHRGSRSPDYRFDAKMEKLRVPFQKQSFGAKYEAGFLSPQKRRFSPQQNSRWFDDSNSGVDHNFRGRRLGGRRFQQGQRLDSVRSSRRLNSDDYFEPMIRPARFSELPSGGRECRYEGSDDDRRKHDGRFEIIHRVRRYDSDGIVRQFRYDEEDRFASRNTQNYDNDCDNRAAERRPPPRDAYVGEIAKRRVN